MAERPTRSVAKSSWTYPERGISQDGLAPGGNAADSECVEAAHIAWRPLGRVLVEQGLLTDDELEQALAMQQRTGERLGETIIKCGFVSGPELAGALAAQYGIELATEKGFGTGLRSEIQRRHESDRRRIVQIVPDPPAARLEVVRNEPATEPDGAPNGEETLLVQLEEQWARLAAAEEALAERERELDELAERERLLVERAEHHERELVGRERALTELAGSGGPVFEESGETRERELAELSERHEREVAQLQEVNERLREQLEELRRAPAEPEEDHAPPLPTSHLVFVQLDERYELLSRDGPPPEPLTPLYLPDVDEGSFVVAGSRCSPFPGDARPCVVALRR